MTNVIRRQIDVRFEHQVRFERGIFAPSNPTLRQIFAELAEASPARVLFVVDAGVARTFPDLLHRIQWCADEHADAFAIAERPLIVAGGEEVKNNPTWLHAMHETIDRGGICRKSFVAAIGGGAVLDMVGYAAATAHRGVQLVRIPTSTLSQCDSGVGVKNGVNALGKKNFLGVFSPPAAVVNDAEFLTTLDDRDWRSGVAEAIKVALIKDPDFFEWIEGAVKRLASRDLDTMETMVRRSAELHLEHIMRGGDPFETGASRPLDFGHWAAHRIEAMSEHRLKHGEAVAIGVALDATYSMLETRLNESEWRRIVESLEAVGFALHAPELRCAHRERDDGAGLLLGLDEFREHLGGRLTVMLLDGIGEPVEVNEMDADLVRQAADLLHERSLEHTKEEVAR